MICTYEHIQIIVDDECYMGKDGQLTECADFGKNNIDEHKELLRTIHLRDCLVKLATKMKLWTTAMLD